MILIPHAPCPPPNKKQPDSGHWALGGLALDEGGSGHFVVEGGSGHFTVEGGSGSCVEGGSGHFMVAKKIIILHPPPRPSPPRGDGALLALSPAHPRGKSVLLLVLLERDQLPRAVLDLMQARPALKALGRQGARRGLCAVWRFRASLPQGSGQAG